MQKVIKANFSSYATYYFIKIKLTKSILKPDLPPQNMCAAQENPEIITWLDLQNL